MMLFGGMRLSEARLCLDCEVIFRGPFCPVCGSPHAPFISRWLSPAPAELNKRFQLLKEAWHGKQEQGDNI